MLAALFGPSLIYMITHINARYSYPVFELCVLLTADFSAICSVARPRATTARRRHLFLPACELEYLWNIIKNVHHIYMYR